MLMEVQLLMIGMQNASNVTISGVTTTGENLGGFKRLVGAGSSTVVSIAVTVATKTADHRYFDKDQQMDIG